MGTLTMETTLIQCLLFIIFMVPFGKCQEDLTEPIKCYFCYGKEDNSTCADPIDAKTNTDLRTEECIHGVCIKWTHYLNGEMMIERTCSARMNLNIMMIDGVCRTESYGNGYLCMCGNNLCNTGVSNLQHSPKYFIILPLLLTLLFVSFSHIS